MNKIIAIIVTYNGMRWIKKCLSNIQESSVYCRILIIDNNSIDGTPQFIKKYYPECVIIENSDNIGFGKANNIGLKYAIDQNADYVALLNQDVYIQKDTVKLLLEFHQIKPNYGILSPIHLNGEGTELDKNFSTYIPYNNLNEIEVFRHRIIDTDFVNAAMWVVPINCIKKVGGFDPLFIHYGEDRDYCNRVTYHGYQIGIAINSSIMHDRKYDAENQFRNLKNHLFSVGLAHLKNINKSLLVNYSIWFYQRVINIMKHLLKVRIINVITELIIIAKLSFMISSVNKSRKTSKTPLTSFIEK